MMTIKTPSNVVELLENLRDLLRSHLPFDKAFFTEETLKGITAAQKINIIHQQENQVLEAEAAGFWTITNNLESHESGLLIGIILEVQPDGKKSVIIDGNINSNQSLLHYLAIEKLIGRTWQPSKPGLWSSNRFYQKPTALYGNAEMEYSHRDGNTEEKGIFIFNPAGYLNCFTLRREERNTRRSR